MELSQTLLFSGVSDHDCSRMLSCFHTYTRRYAAGELIARYDGGSSRVGILERGEAVLERFDINGSRSLLEEIHEGDIFGEAIAFSNITRDDCAVRCIKEAEVLYIPMEELTKRCEKACACHSQVVANLLSIITGKVMRLSQRVEILSCRSIRERLLCYFRSLAKPGETFNIPCSLAALSDYICADRSAMTRELGRMREEGIIAGGKRRYRIIDN